MRLLGWFAVGMLWGAAFGSVALATYLVLR